MMTRLLCASLSTLLLACSTPEPPAPPAGTAPSTAPASAPDPGPGPAPHPGGEVEVEEVDEPQAPIAAATTLPFKPAAAAPTPSGQGTCPDGRLVRPGWQGEYPMPILHVQTDAPLPARSSACAPQADRSCRPTPGVYHPWSRSLPPAGAKADRFVTVRGVDRWRMLREHRPEGWRETLPAGAVVEVLFYAGEGYCEERVEGGAVDVQPCPDLWPEGTAERIAPAEEPAETQLVRVPCAQGGAAWLEGSAAIFEQASVAEGELIEYGQVGPAGGGACDELVVQARFGEFTHAGRAVMALVPGHPQYTTLISSSLGAPVQLEALWKVDLDGDGTEEVLFEAEDPKSGRRTLGLRALRGDAVRTLSLWTTERDEPPLRLRGLADVDGDGTLELVRKEDGAQAPGLTAWSLSGEVPARADDERCGW